jgi:hypothetical protein
MQMVRKKQNLLLIRNCPKHVKKVRFLVPKS